VAAFQNDHEHAEVIQVVTRAALSMMLLRTIPFSRSADRFLTACENLTQAVGMALLKT